MWFFSFVFLLIIQVKLTYYWTCNMLSESCFFCFSITRKLEKLKFFQKTTTHPWTLNKNKNQNHALWLNVIWSCNNSFDCPNNVIRYLRFHWRLARISAMMFFIFFTMHVDIHTRLYVMSNARLSLRMNTTAFSLPPHPHRRVRLTFFE